MKNISLIIYSLKGGGAERVVSLLSQELSKRYNLYLIVFDSDNMAYSYGGELIDLNIKSHDSVLVKCINVIRRVYLVRKIKKQYNIHTSISFLGSANIVNVLSRRDDRVIISIRSHNQRKGGILGLANILLSNKADKIVAISQGVYFNLIDNFRFNQTKTGYIYNPIDLKKIKILLKDNSTSNNLFERSCFTIINVGRLTNVKGQRHLIRAFSHVKRSIKSAKLIILGEGDLKPYLKDLADKLGLANDVVFAGFKTNPFKYIKNADLFAFSSLREGFGNVLIEAMACGVPVISTDCRSGPREILAPRTDVKYEAKGIEYCEYGVLVPVCDGGKLLDHTTPLTKGERFLAEGIVSLYKNEKLRMNYSRKGIKRAKDFDINNIVERWERLIKTVYSESLREKNEY